ncbi:MULTISPECIES: sensor histidine kinase [unclassified Streptomyces]|uniref:sensor histidine kinase n=1 Tax=unclassified Streptomyces TaxID=2593676 RepID=UPI000747FE4B|nr:MULTISPECIES: sensor histidine kinase [unclassified Streptomyces]KUL47451.1 histidine kinase [Streptomyces sp. NRRL S-1521]THC51981.1 HAMP domain-containing protein [Streptomyces sp. A1499]
MTGVESQARASGRSPWTTRRWLRVGVAVSLLILVLLGSTGAWVLARTESLSTDLTDVRSPALTTAIRLESAMLNQETGIRGYGLTGTPEFRAPYDRGLVEQKASMKELAGLLDGDRAGLEGLKAVREAVGKWQERIARPIAAARPGSPSPLATERAEEGKTSFDEVRTALNDQQKMLRADRAGARKDLVDTMAVRNWVFGAIGVVILGLIAVVFEGLRRGINRPLERLGSDARTIAGGDFDHPITPTGPADLRHLSGEIDSMRRRLVRELDFKEQARVRLDAQAADLRRSNAELEQFAYVASHDLQEPLRKVSSFTQLLQRRYGGQLDDRADQYIDFAVDGANRMQVLINDLLDFSRVGRLHNDQQEVDLDKVFERTLSALSVSIEESEAVVTHDGLPTLVADPTQMGMLWQNLIANAVKFRRPGVAPRVRVTAVREDELWRFTVTDNGIGIPEEFTEKIFVIFQRLHTKDAYPGSGIGLAMCKKIVEFHGGTIAVDPGYREGARITFTLAPEPPEHADALMPALPEPAPPADPDGSL